jgi:hypothetical protein
MNIFFLFAIRAVLDFYSASSLKQQSAGRHVAPLEHIILIPSQTVFALSPYCYVLSREVTNTNFIVFGLTRPGFEPTISSAVDRGFEPRSFNNHNTILTLKSI